MTPNHRASALALPLAMLLAGCAGAPILPDGAEAWSLSGEALYPPAASAEVTAQREQQLAAAFADHMVDPDDADALIWYGRRLAYLGRYRDAIDVFSRGIELHPDDARMRRHRGHRFITVRDFAAARRDLAKAHELAAPHDDRVEPDGQPNAANVPIGTLKSNIDYHLALAMFLQGDYETAVLVHRRRLAAAENADRLCSTTYWLYLTLMRLGRVDEASAALEPIHADMELLENFGYHRLLLLYKGELTVDDFNLHADDGVQNATAAYGVANHLMLSGDDAAGQRLLDDILAMEQWAAFGYIAAEADVADPARLPATTP